MCGVRMTLGRPRRGCPSSSGSSCAKTSSPAPDTTPSSSARARSASITVSPRPTLISRGLRRIRAKVSRLKKPRFVSLRFMWLLTTSARASSSGASSSSTSISRARDSGTKGSWATTRMPKACARRATARPMAPNPRMPRVCPSRRRMSGKASHFQSPSACTPLW